MIWKMEMEGKPMQWKSRMCYLCQITTLSSGLLNIRSLCAAFQGGDVGLWPTSVKGEPEVKEKVASMGKMAHYPSTLLHGAYCVALSFLQHSMSSWKMWLVSLQHQYQSSHTPLTNVNSAPTVRWCTGVCHEQWTLGLLNLILSVTTFYITIYEHIHITVYCIIY